MAPARLRSAALALLLLAGPAVAEAPADKTPAENQISSFLLDNGMEVVVIPDRRAPIVTHMVWYKVGSADEPPGKSGIAHFFEHLMFKGTAKHKAGEFGAKIAEIGGSENAFTTDDYTAYYQTVTPEALETMMEFEADRMRNLILTDAVIGPERDVILEERRSRIENNPEALLAEEIDATLYQNHPYRIPVIGWMHEMEKLNRTDAVAFYDRYYAPNNAILVVAGDVDAKEVRALAEKTYGKVARGPDLPPRIRPSEPEQNTGAHGDADRSARFGAELFAGPGWCRPTTPPSPARPRRSTCCPEILGGGMRSRIYQALVVKTRHRLVGRRLFRRLEARSRRPSRSMARRAARPSSTRSQAAIDAEIARHRQGRRDGEGTGERQEPFPALDDLRARQPGLDGQPLRHRRWRPAAP